VAVALAAFGLGERRVRVLALAAALFVAGLWWGSVRLDALDHSELRLEIGRAGPALLEVTGPSRRSPFEVRVPVRVLRFDGESPGERAWLDLPAGRAPPQGALLSAIVEVGEPRPEEDGFDEAGYLRRQGVHVILTASTFRVVGRRGGLGGIADRVRGAIARSLAPGVSGERRAVIAAVVLGEDEGLSPGLRDQFRASGLYHLLKKTIKGRTSDGVSPKCPGAARGQALPAFSPPSYLVVWPVCLSRENRNGRCAIRRGSLRWTCSATCWELEQQACGRVALQSPSPSPNRPSRP
jgi:hypothetical protein